MGSFEEAQRSHDIGLDEGIGIANGPIDMAFGREVDYGLRPVLFQNLRNCLDIADVRTKKDVARITGKFRKILQISCVGQAVDINNEVCRGAHPVMDEVCPYKSSPPGNQHHEPAPTESDLNRPANPPVALLFATGYFSV